MDYSEQLIVKGLKAGDTDAYRYIFDTHYQVLCYIAHRYVRDRFVAETIVGDMIYRLWENRASISISTSLRSYLSQGVRNGCVDYLRSKHQRYEIAQSALAAANAMPDADDGAQQPLDLLVGKELQERVDDAIAHLPSECRRVFEMSRFMGKRHAEIAAELGIAVSTVKYHIRNALQQLSRQLGPYVALLLFAGVVG